LDNSFFILNLYCKTIVLFYWILWSYWIFWVLARKSWYCEISHYTIVTCWIIPILCSKDTQRLEATKPISLKSLIMNSFTPSAPPLPSFIQDKITKLQQYRLWLQNSYQKILDDSSPWIKVRWAVTAAIMLIYILRVTILGGWYIVSYALGIYLLNLLIGFLSPQVDPEAEFDVSLPTSSDDEFRPFVRRLPEFKFWYSCCRACVIAILCTLTRKLDIPVFYPILLLYFIALFVVTMKKQIKHMIKYKYIPITLGKPKYMKDAKW